MGRKSGENLGMTYCHHLGGNQVFAYTKRQQIMSDDNCLDASSRSGPVKLVRCHGMGGNQAWVYDEVVSILIFKWTKIRDGMRGKNAIISSNEFLKHRDHIEILFYKYFFKTNCSPVQ